MSTISPTMVPVLPESAPFSATTRSQTATPGKTLRRSSSCLPVTSSTRQPAAPKRRRALRVGSATRPSPARVPS